MVETFGDKNRIELAQTGLKEPAPEGAHSAVRLVKWEEERPSQSTKQLQPVEVVPIKLADASAAETPDPGYSTVTFDTAKGFDKPIPPDPYLAHLTLDVPNGATLATSLIDADAQGPVSPHYHTIISVNGVAKGQFDVPPKLQDITLHYTDDHGYVHDRTYEASSLRLTADSNVINSKVNDFKRPVQDSNRPASEWYPVTSSEYEYAYRLSDIPGRTLGFMEQNLVDDKATDTTSNPFISLNLAEVRVGLAMQHYQNSRSSSYDDDTSLQEHDYAMKEIKEAQKDYNSAMVLAQKDMQALPDGDPRPHNPNDFLRRRYFPESTYDKDYLPQVYGAAIDTSIWRNSQMRDLEGKMKNNATLPARIKDPID